MRDASRAAMYAAAAGLGLIVYLLVFGPGHLVGSGPYWEMPTPDERMYLIGYRYLVHAPWHWPLLASDTIDVPFRASVAYWDVIPLWALVNKALATIVPPWEAFSAHAYLGMWHALTYVLQACFGVACLRALGHRSWFATITGALFFLAVPAWIYRGWHDALSAHWIELWALYLYLRARIGPAWLAQLAVGAMITPYHPVMSLGVFAAALIRTRKRRTIALWLGLGLATVAAATWLAGYFDAAGTDAQWGFEEESTNLLSWLVPVRGGILGNADWIASVMATPWQYEGYAYLGLGYLALLGWLAPQVAVVRSVVRRHAALFGVALGFAAVALSNHIYFGSHLLASYRVPHFLHWIPDHFRSPGRFVWIAMYAAIIFVLHRALLRFQSRRGRALLVAILALQLADARGDWADHHAAVHGPQWWRVLDLDATRGQLAPYAAVDIEPSYTCITGPDLDRLSEVSSEIAMLASERALPINGTYNARLVRDCATEQAAWASLVPAPGTLYVVLPPAAALGDRLVAAGAACTPFAYGHMCAVR